MTDSANAVRKWSPQRSPKKMKKELENAVDAANQRAAAMHQKVGEVSTHFTALENMLLDALSLLVGAEDTWTAWVVLSQMTFRQSVSAFRAGVAARFPTEAVVRDVRVLCRTFDKLSKRRNDLIHSAWYGSTQGSVRQQRARVRAHTVPIIAIHEDEPDDMNSLVSDIQDAIIQLSIFQGKHLEKRGEQIGAP